MTASRRGMTLVEVAVVVTIIAVLTAILVPVYSAAKERGKETRCMNNFKQLFQAISTYRSENDGDGKYGSAAEMGLPLNVLTLLKDQSLPLDLLHCYGRPGGMVPGAAIYSVYFTTPETRDFPRWSIYAREQKENSILMGDINHGEQSQPLGSPYFPHKGIGLRLSGQIFTQVKKGTWNTFEWWSSRDGGSNP